ncbi:MAG TPA: hypothetical protein VNF27_07415 [Candidatus Binataceae bacterium]|nr:hypothetical protein [Candidatus Binataceae bacterium]
MIDRVHKTGKPMVITKFGKPVAQISPLEEKPVAKRCLGSMAGTARIIGDIIEPAVPIEDYDAFKPNPPIELAA